MLKARCEFGKLDAIPMAVSWFGGIVWPCCCRLPLLEVRLMMGRARIAVLLLRLEDQIPESHLRLVDRHADSARSPSS